MDSIRLNIASILPDSNVGGPGLRDLIWLQGCSIGCKGCFNKHLWNYEPKYIVPVDKLIDKFRSRVGKIEGVTLLGGEPTEQAYGLSYFLEGIKELGLTTVVYTGRTHKWHLKKNDKWVNRLLKFTDILIDGLYIEEKYDSRLLWRGSTNQKIIFLSSIYNDSILDKYLGNPKQEIHVFVEGNKKIVYETGID